MNPNIQESGFDKTSVWDESSLFSSCNLSNCDLRNVFASSCDGNTVFIQDITDLWSVSSLTLTGDDFPSDLGKTQQRQNRY